MASFHVTVSDSVFPNLDPARQVLATIGAELQMADSPTPEGIVRGGRVRRRPARHLREDHGRDDPADAEVPDHLALRDRRGQRRHRRGDRRGHRRHQGAGLLHRRSLRSRDGAAAGARPQDPVIECAHAQRAMGDESGRADSSTCAAACLASPGSAEFRSSWRRRRRRSA